MERIILFLSIICITAVSCTKEKTDYEAELDRDVTEHMVFEEAASISIDGYDIRIEALNGTFYKGYNEVRLKVSTTAQQQSVNPVAMTFLPLADDGHGTQSSCPHRYDLVYNSDGQYFSGYVVFTDPSSSNTIWDLYLSFTLNNQIHTVKKSITVAAQNNKNLNMTSFTGLDGEQYTIALIAPQKPKVAENTLLAGIYKFQKPTATASGAFPDPTQYTYTEVSGYKLRLDPRMPEPSMGNHSSPNNKDLTQQQDGSYQGVVNYTMTGNWTLNFILLNQQGRIISGTEVSTEHTPGIEGAKSELYIDILF